jgi:cytidine deaminase
MKITKKQKEKLIRLAIKARENSYCPYSGYKVGASILAASGKYYVGCNIENAAYSPTTHGEVNAINAAVAAGERRFLAIAVITENKIPPFPCCICRQSIAEFDDGTMEVIAANTEGTVREIKFYDLYPEPFGTKQLGIDPGKH